jgi:hypothetical protein
MYRERRTVFILVLLLFVLQGCFRASEQILHAKYLYNAGYYQQAIDEARKVKADEPTAPQVDLLLSRSYTQLYRITKEAKHLDLARAHMLAALKGYPFEHPWENHELVTGLAEIHYWDDERGPAAELFHSVILEGNKKIAPQSYANAVDWWASTLTGLIANMNPTDPIKVSTEKEIKSTIEKAYRQSYGGEPVLAYWMALVHVREGNVGKAWDVAVAGYVRALPQSHPDTEDISDKLANYIEQVIIPKSPDRDNKLKRWNAIKERWTPKK